MKKPKLMDFFSDNKIAKIPLDEIDYDYSFHPYPIKFTKHEEQLAEHVGEYGLIQPIIVSPKNESGKRIVYSGVRRALAYRYLNKKNPKKGYDKIPCSITNRMLTVEEHRIVIHDEGAYRRQDCTEEDMKRIVSSYFRTCGDIEIVAKTLGMKFKKTARYLLSDILPPDVKEYMENQGYSIGEGVEVLEVILLGMKKREVDFDLFKSILNQVGRKFTNNRGKFCPKCKSKKVKTIFWGLPNGPLTEKFFENSVLGGDDLPALRPRWQCDDCNFRWG